MPSPVVCNASLGGIAALLARAYLRLTQKRRSVALSDAENPQIPLELSPAESPHVVQETPRWERACSVKSTGFGR